MASTFVALAASFMLTFLHIVSGQTSQVPKTIVANSDPQIIYSPAICSETGVIGCLGAWWDTVLANGSVIKTTAGPSSGYKNVQTTLSYSFYGSGIELHGLVDTDGANMVIQVDNFMAIVNTSTGIGGVTQQPYTLYNNSQLNPQIVHTLSVGWSANMNPNMDAGGYKPLSYVYFDRLIIGDFRAVTDSDGSEPSSSATPTQTAVASSIQANSTKLKPGSLAGIIIVVMLFIMVLCALSFQLLRRRRLLSRWRKPSSSQIRIMIESRETCDVGSAPSPTQSESWKPRPHMSLPPAYGYAKRGYSEKAVYGSEKGVSYLDLEPGNRESVAESSSSSSNTPNEQKKRKSRLSLLPIPLSPTQSPRVSHPPRAKLQVNTRASTIAPRNHPFAGGSITPTQDEQERSPITPFTPYCVGTATVARPQNAQLVSNSSLHGGESSASRQLSTVPLPPLPPMPSPREEKRHPSNLTSSRRSRKVSRTHTSKVDKEVGVSNALEVELHTMATTPRLSFDATSVMTRSIPPPYTLHV